jgi:hypothetical protein
MASLIASTWALLAPIPATIRAGSEGTMCDNVNVIVETTHIAKTAHNNRLDMYRSIKKSSQTQVGILAGQGNVQKSPSPYPLKRMISQI